MEKSFRFKGNLKMKIRKEYTCPLEITQEVGREYIEEASKR